MKKVFYYLVFSFILLFSFSYMVNAECSYSERVQLLKEAEEVDIFFELASEKVPLTGGNFVTGEMETVYVDSYYFNMNIVNLSDNLYIKIKNLTKEEDVYRVEFDDLVNGTYSIRVDNLISIYNYEVDIYSSGKSCNIYKINTERVRKPRFNNLSTYSICQNESIKDTNYCKKYVDEEFPYDDMKMVEYLKKIIETNKSENNTNDNKNETGLIFKYSFLILGIFAVIVVGVIITLIIKKRGELK